jgi:hypothetical protein
MNGETDYYLSEARNGDLAAAYHGLIELPNDLLPDLEVAYRGEADPVIRALIVEAVWQHQLPCSVDFLAVALEDPLQRKREKSLSWRRAAWRNTMQPSALGSRKRSTRSTRERLTACNA